MSVIISRYNGYGQHEGYPLGNVLGIGFSADRDSSDDRASGEESGGIYVCVPGGLSNGKFVGHLGGNILGGLFGAYSGMGTWEG